MNFLPVNPDAIPQALRSRDRWVYWRHEPDPKTGKMTKQPHRVGDPKDRHASSTNPKTWATLDYALAGMGNGFTHHGIGYVFHKPKDAVDEDLTFFDFDHVRNPETGEVASWAATEIVAMNSYAEVSPSGTGVHVYAFGGFKGKGLKVEFLDGTKMEAYCRGRYGTITGHSIPGTPADLQVCDVQSFYDRLKHGQIRPAGALTEVDDFPEPEPELGSQPDKSASDVRELLEKFGHSIKAVENPYQGDTEVGVRYTLDACPFDPNHEDSSVFDFPSGPVFFCFHASCKAAGYTWRHVCSKYEYTAPDLSDFAWRHQLIKSDAGKPKALLANAVLTLRHSPEWKGVLGFNEFSLYAVTRKPAPWPQSVVGKNWNDEDDARCAVWLQQNGIQVSSRIAAEAAQTVAKEFPFHPVRSYLSSLVWDGQPRTMQWLATYLGAERSPLNAAIGHRWLISCCARVFQPGCQCDHTLLLEGPQGAGKSSALQILAGDSWFSDHLSDLGSKDSRLELCGRWIIELAEFVSRKSELEKKAFLTTRADCFRAPYERRPQWVPRQCVFAASTNDATPLTDESGSRRYWGLTVGAIDLARLRADRDHLWAEAYQSYLSGEPWWDDFAEFRDALTAEQESRYLPGPNDELILRWLERPVPRVYCENGVSACIEPFDSDREKTTITDVLLHALGKPRHALSRTDQLSVRACLVHAGWKRSRQTKIPGTNRNVRFYIAPQPTMKKLGEE